MKYLISGTLVLAAVLTVEASIPIAMVCVLAALAVSHEASHT